jgi:hypothetical protein
MLVMGNLMLVNELGHDDSPCARSEIVAGMVPMPSALLFFDSLVTAPGRCLLLSARISSAERQNSASLTQNRSTKNQLSHYLTHCLKPVRKQSERQGFLAQGFDSQHDSI